MTGLHVARRSISGTTSPGQAKSPGPPKRAGALLCPWCLSGCRAPAPAPRCARRARAPRASAPGKVGGSVRLRGVESDRGSRDGRRRPRAACRLRLPLRCDLLRDAAPVVDRNPAFPRPGPDLCRTLPVARAPRPRHVCRGSPHAAQLARSLKVRAHLRPELACVGRAQIDLVSFAVQAEENRSVGRASVEIILKERLNALRHLFPRFPRWDLRKA
jgi:hypothetical protein